MNKSMRRFTRLTNGFSKKVENHAHAVALHFMHYNFCRIHKTLRVTPAMAAGVTQHVWSLEEVIGLLDAAVKKAALLGGQENGRTGYRAASGRSVILRISRSLPPRR